MPNTSPPSTAVPATPARRRAAWRQRLVDAERGFSQGVRSDSSLFFYLFVDSALVAMGLVLGLEAWQWAVVGLAVTGVLTAELLHQAFKALVQELPAPQGPRSWQCPQHLAAAAVAVAFLGGSLVVCLIYWHRLAEIYGD